MSAHPVTEATQTCNSLVSLGWHRAPHTPGAVNAKPAPRDRQTPTRDTQSANRDRQTANRDAQTATGGFRPAYSG